MSELGMGAGLYQTLSHVYVNLHAHIPFHARRNPTARGTTARRHPRRARAAAPPPTPARRRQASASWRRGSASRTTARWPGLCPFKSPAPASSSAPPSPRSTAWSLASLGETPMARSATQPALISPKVIAQFVVFPTSLSPSQETPK